jgi:hypothetical protein
LIEFPQLPEAISAVGALGASLASLSKSPTSKAAAGILAGRVGFAQTLMDSNRWLELYECTDSGGVAIALPSPFALVVLDTAQMTSDADGQTACEELQELLRERDLHTRPAIILINGSDKPVAPVLKFSQTPSAILSGPDLVEVLIAHPPRTALMRRILARTPLTLLNPYIFRGPIGPRLFRGRHEQLKRLSTLQTSYALIGPRAIGKTSLMNMAYEKLRDEGVYTVRVEHSAAMTEQDLCVQIIDAFIREYRADEKLRLKPSPQRVQRLIQDYVMRSSPKRIAILVDEADLLNEHCPELSATFRLCHNHGWAKFIFVGFLKLLKAVSDRTHSISANLAQQVPLSGMSREECGALVVQPMLELGIHFENVEEVVSTVYQESGGSPSRIQLLCHYMIDGLGSARPRTIGKPQAMAAISHPEVKKFFAAWFFESTTPLGQWMSALATRYVPCNEKDIVLKASREFPDLTWIDFRSELNDLITANILEYTEGDVLNFSFPAMREIARPTGTASEVLQDLRRTARTLRTSR